MTATMARAFVVVISLLIVSRSVEFVEGTLNTTVICSNEAKQNCKPLGVEYFSSSSSRDADKIVMVNVATGPETSRKFALCHPENENLQTYLLTNAVNLLSHVFCRQMGYMTYTGRQAAAAPPTQSDDTELRAVWPGSILCNGTEQRLEDCYWPEIRLANCRQFLEVQCGACSKFFAHVDDGIITSPGFPNSFPYTVACDWLIYTKLGEGIELRFTSFNLPTTQLPMSQIGSSSCVASNAFLEISPNVHESLESESPGGENANPQNSPAQQQVPSPALVAGGTTAEEKILANSRRYCVYKIPNRRMKIRSKAVLIHFSSGIHSAFFYNSYRPRSSYLGRMQQRPVGIKIYFRALPPEPVLPTVSTTEVDLIRDYLVKGLIVLSSIVIVASIVIVVWMRSRYNAHIKAMMSSDSAVVGKRVSISKWKRVVCCLGLGDMQASKADHAMNNYEEIAARPAVPPRTFTVPGRSNVTESTALPSMTTRSSQRSCSGVSIHSSPLSSRKYMQIVCSSAGHCQYIPVEEIETHGDMRRISIKSDKVYGIYRERSESSV